MPPATDLTGADDYMTGLTQFAQGVVPGGAASVLAAPVGSGSAARIAAHRGHGRICPNEPWFLRPGPGDPRPGYPGRDRGSPKRGITLLSKRVMMLIRSPRRVRTISPFACRTAPCGSRRYTPNAGWPLARVATSR